MAGLLIQSVRDYVVVEEVFQNYMIPGALNLVLEHGVCLEFSIKNLTFGQRKLLFGLKPV